ncbi:MAG: hypothetical protein FWD06_07155 [Oscillospiraceae bacterium]|nr:hypothetical protein [Oscillospiraceae bacterium]
MKHTKRLLALLLTLLLALGISAPAMANVPGIPGIAQQPQSVELDPTHLRQITVGARVMNWHIPSGGTSGFQWQRVDGNAPVNVPLMFTVTYADLANGPQQFRVVVYNSEDRDLPLMERRHVISDTITVSRYVPSRNNTLTIFIAVFFIGLIAIIVAVPLVLGIIGLVVNNR